jgi:hypothetical protein
MITENNLEITLVLKAEELKEISSLTINQALN